MTCRGMLMCLILTPIWHCTGGLWRIQKVGQISLIFVEQCFLAVLLSDPVCVQYLLLINYIIADTKSLFVPSFLEGGG